ncbi:unnamed protein product [Paramecium octaurelia]|uniref:Uncharacterized protein n=1 Tax=Paramecium octaurelia TaxID=43137 RepID=A0A8S1RYT6_PAROT|nr:unnamed protein product [Paramecium octaurelia]
MKKNQSLFKRVLITGERGKYKACQICLKRFGTEHQCKRCKRAIRDKCQNYKGRFLRRKANQQRDLWILIISSFSKILKQLNCQIQFGVTKEQGKTEYLQAQSKIQQNEQSEIRKVKNNLNVAFAEIPGVFNYSLKEFIYYVLKENEYETMKQVTGRVLETFLFNYNEVGFSLDLIMLTVFFLCFGSQSAAFLLLNIFSQRWFKLIYIPLILFHMIMEKILIEYFWFQILHLKCHIKLSHQLLTF